MLYISVLAILFFFPNWFLFFQTWRQCKEGDPWPGRREDHIATCLGYGGQHQRLLISGGYGDPVTYDDIWLMDPQSGRMEKVRMNLEKWSCSFCLRIEDSECHICLKNFYRRNY